MARIGFGRLAAVLLFVASVGAAGCVFVPVPPPFVGPPVIVGPRPVVVAPRRPARGYYRPYGHYHGRGHGWGR